MKLQRLARMQPAELAFRLRQQVHKTIERVVASEPEAAPQLIWATDHQDLQKRLQKRFFAGVADMASSDCTTEHGFWRSKVRSQRLIAGADAVCQGEFDILGYGRLSFGKPIDWHLDPVAGRVSPWVHWSQINPLDFDQVGDSKVVWELNRHQWLLELGQAYQLTGDERYARCFANFINGWMLANPPGWGVNWSSALEVAMRLISWCWALCLFQRSEALTPKLFQTMLAWMQRHAVFVEQHLSRYFSPNTHLTVEALGLFYAGVLLPELKGASRWRTLGLQILVEQMPIQVNADGVYFEQSTRYQYYTAEIYLHFVILAERNGVCIPGSIRERLEKLLECLLHMQRPDGSVPQIGDTDGGWLLPLVRRAPGDYRGLFSIAAVAFKNSHFSWAAAGLEKTHLEQKGLAEEALMLLGAASADAWQQQVPTEPPAAPLSCFKEGGYVVMRNGWGRQAHHLIFDTGPLGCRVSGGHGHADLLAIQCSAWGEAYLVDSGTGCYTADPQWRNYFRSSRAHSTLMVDGLGQAEPDGPFSWLKRPAAHLRQCGVNSRYLLADAQHSAYSGLSDPVTHRRRVMMSDSAYWIVVDDLLGDALHHLDLRYQFAPLPLMLEQDGWVRAQGSGSALLIKVFSPVPLELEIQTGELDPIAGWHSPNYGQRVAAPSLSCSTDGRLPLRLVTLIYPVQNRSATPPKVGLRMEAGRIVSLDVESGWPHTLHFDDDVSPLLAGEGNSFQFLNLSSDPAPGPTSTHYGIKPCVE